MDGQDGVHCHNAEHHHGANPHHHHHDHDDKKEWSHMLVLDSLTSKSHEKEIDAVDHNVLYKIAVNASWLVNWFLLGAKLYTTIVSSSKAVLASLADSAVDLVSQAVLSLADRYMNRHSPEYPVGRSRLEALSVIACAFIMSMASIEVIQFSGVDLYDGLMGKEPSLIVDTTLYVILGIGIFLKLVLWIFCLKINEKIGSDTLAALAEDHFNDVISNTAAIATAAVAYHTVAWWVDPVGAILISLVIIYRWVAIISEQVKKIVGYTAPPEFIEQVEKLAFEHDSRLDVDCTRVYHFGARFNVEMEIVLPGDMTVAESHDIALDLQHKIESLDDVERAFVHVDHQRRDGLEHKIERNLVRSTVTNPMQVETEASPENETGLRARLVTPSNNSNKV